MLARETGHREAPRTTVPADLHRHPVNTLRGTRTSRPSAAELAGSRPATRRSGSRSGSRVGALAPAGPRRYPGSIAPGRTVHLTEVVGRLKTALAERYVVERKLGSGGMAMVYLARDLPHHRQVAVKVLRPELAATLGSERLLYEIETGARFQHPTGRTRDRWR
jgi:Serine/threonine protein kinase